MEEKLGIVINEILGYDGKNKRHAELQRTIDKYIKIQKSNEYAQWIDRNNIKAWYLPYPLITYEEYITLKANIGARRVYLNGLNRKSNVLVENIPKHFFRF